MKHRWLGYMILGQLIMGVGFIGGSLRELTAPCTITTWYVDVWILGALVMLYGASLDD